MKSYNNLKEIELTSEEYTAKAADNSFEDHLKYINKIQTNYTGFKNNYNNVIDQIAPKDRMGKSGKTLSRAYKRHIKENKKISEIILDKLIQEVILNK